MRFLRSAAILVAAVSPFFAATPAGAQPLVTIGAVTQGPCNGNGGMEFVRCGYINGAHVCLIYCDDGQ